MDNNTKKKSFKPLITILIIIGVLLISGIAFLLIYPIASADVSDNEEEHVSTVVSRIYLNGEEFVKHIEDVTNFEIPDSSTTWSDHTEHDTFSFEFNEHHNTLDYFTCVFFDDTSKEELEAFEKQIEEDERFKSALGDLKRILDIDGGEVLDEHKLVYVMDTEEFNTLPDRAGEYRIITIFYDIDLQVLVIREYNTNYYKSVYPTQ